MEIQNLGLINYADALEIQMQSVDAVINSNDKSFLPEKIILCEHPLVITVGRALDSIKEIFVKEDVIPIHHVSRGGRATLHLPGQIVCYPIVSLESRGRDLHGFMRLLEEAIIETLADFRIEATRLEGKTGVWIQGEKKIASVGIAVKKWVTYHGLSLNVDCDLGAFRHLAPCGFQSQVMTSIVKQMSPTYLREWSQVVGRVKKDVSQRLIENLLDLLKVK